VRRGREEPVATERDEAAVVIRGVHAVCIAYEQPSGKRAPRRNARLTAPTGAG
jgi:hypothetical protein